MKKIIKVFAVMAALAVFGTSGLFAQKIQKVLPEIELTSFDYENLKEIAPIVKIKGKKNAQTILLKTEDGKTYVADSIGEEGRKAIDFLEKRNNKKAILSGFLNKKTGVFTIVKYGRINNSDIGVDEK
ncbi:MAG: hypothetical protein K5829_03070 [Treponema sp.]|nr:hypothetical protein [Treponema sp.]